MNQPSARPDHLTVIADHSPGPHVTDSDDIQWWWPVLGPSASCLATLISRHSRCGDITWPAAVLAQRIGIGGLCSKLWATLDRLEGFGLLTFVSTDVAAVRVNLPELTARQLNHLAPDMAAAYLASIRTSEVMS